ncbi:hypothetical protein JQ605_10150 [Bradyrhizobium sp. AUGA SZCCT0042]|nr:hypothetical protein [Bradyrhizobium sp. AUGA SZCCT0182]MBR1237901.1 hypothetical protein [Bradyrhizobium sp. AUGA SZCCT0182]MBR1297143.1 hypothetical protein [Bradyrhizobium sp. AUGA SZCCT0042]
MVENIAPDRTNRLRVQAYVDAKGAKRLLKALKANIAILDDDEDEEAIN